MQCITILTHIICKTKVIIIDVMIKLTNVSYRYPSSKRDNIAKFSMELNSGKIVGLLGANGSGKSTLLYLMSGLLKPKSGDIEINGYNPWQRDPEFFSQIFLVPEEIEIPSVTFEKFVEANSPFFPNFSEESLNESLKHFNLTPDIHLGSLSMGQRKKAFLAFALAAHTPVLLMDEPTNGLDIPGKSEFRKAIAQTMDDNRTIVISTHQVRDLEQLLDHVTIMDNTGILLNQSITRLQQEFSFGIAPTPPSEGVIWSEPIMGGFFFMKHKTEGEPETEINLEGLFNYVYSRTKSSKSPINE